jgi:hypothetical protein
MFTGANKERLFIYVTTKALSSPRLHIIKADQLTQEVIMKVGEIRLEVQDVPVSETINSENLTS